MSNILNILILDDNRSKHDLIQIRMSRFLSQKKLDFNLVFLECETVEQAFEAIKETSFDILCLDHELHAGKTGFDFISMWEENPQGVKPQGVKPQGHVIIHSGNPHKAFQMKVRLNRLNELHQNSLLTTCATYLTLPHHYEFWYENVTSPFFEGKGTSCHPLQAK